MWGRVCLVTGANRGIGYEVAAGLLRQGARVLLACRSPARGAAAAWQLARDAGNEPQVGEVDLASQASIRRFAQWFAGHHDRLDVLVHNAATIPRRRALTPEGVEMQLAVNHLAPFLLTQELRPLLEQSPAARVIVVSSNSHFRARLDFDDLQCERSYSRQRRYQATKLANVLFTLDLSRRLQGRKITVNAVRPGTINTRLVGDFLGPLAFGRWLFAVTGTPARGAAPIVRLAADPALANTTGQYYDRFRPRRAAEVAYDRRQQERLWDVSERLVAGS